jgi:Asp-tRNA(Asn)/Glu-tRNA(Gln) amidotransferase A subunit family amidase
MTETGLPSFTALQAMASLYDLDDPARHAAWMARMEVDAATLGLLRTAPVPADQSPVDVYGLTRRDPGTRAAPTRVGHSPPVVGIARLALDVRQRRRTASSGVERALAGAQDNSGLNAFTHLFQDAARAEAAALDARVARGEDVGPLAGVTVAVKDLVDVEGYATTGGTRVLGRRIAAQDADCVARLRSAGAVVVGMANLHGLAYGALSVNPDFGRVRNPRHEQALAGGSSGGSAAAVAAGTVDVAIGTDTAGSVRIPAACCGVVGLKPTYGRVRTDGVHPLAPTMDTVGPLTTSAADAALMLQVLSPTPFSASDTAWSELEGVTVGFLDTYFRDHLAPEVRAALTGARTAVEAAGGRVVDLDIPIMRHAPAAQLYTLAAEAFDVHREMLRDRGSLLPEDVRVRLETGMFFLAADYVRAQRLRGLMQAQFDHALTRADVLMTPTVAMTAPDVGTTRVAVDGAEWPIQSALSRLTMPFNLTGHPALTLPFGADERGRPIGLQIVGRAMDEVSVLGVGRVLEQLRETYLQ